MKKTIVTFECDNCGNTGVPEELDQSNPLPARWIDLGASNNHGHIFDLQLCTECMTAIGKTLGERGYEKK